MTEGSDQRPNERECLVELVGQRTAGLREVGPTATVTAHALGNGLDELAGVVAARQVLGDTGHETDLVGLDAAEHDDP